MGRQQCTGRTVSGQDIDYAGRKSDLCADLREEECGQGSVFGRLEHNGVAHRQCGRDLPGQHQQREIPRNDLSYDSDRFVFREFGGHQLRPTGVMIEVTGDERNVDVARLADRFAVVERFENREQTGMFLNLSGEGIEIAGAPMRAQVPPSCLRVARGRHGGIHVCRSCLRDRCEHAACRRIECLEALSRRARAPLTGDKQPEGAVMLRDPCIRRGCALGSGAIIHRLKYLRHCRHRSSLSRPGAALSGCCLP